MGQGGREWQQRYGVQGEISGVWGYWPRFFIPSLTRTLSGILTAAQITVGNLYKAANASQAEANALKQESSKKMDLKGALELY